VRPSGLEVTLAELKFEGDTHLSKAERTQIASELSQSTYWGDLEKATDEIRERVRAAWMNRGYFKVQVRCDARTLTSSPISQRIAVTILVDDGPQYRLGRITFKNNKAISNTRALRSLFPAADGDVFSREKIGKGLENLRKAYGEFGYLNFTSVPDTRFDEQQNLIYLDIDMDEGKQFYISSINVVGADAQVLNDLALTPGQAYNVRLVETFLRQHLPGANVNDPNIQGRFLDERKGTVALTFDFRSCPAE
jgi:outer membrane protein assembly factor BamA